MSLVVEVKIIIIIIINNYYYSRTLHSLLAMQVYMWFIFTNAHNLLHSQIVNDGPKHIHQTF